MLEESCKFPQSFFTPEDIAHIVTALHIARTFTVDPQNEEITKKLALIDPNSTEFFRQNVSRHLVL